MKRTIWNRGLVGGMVAVLAVALVAVWASPTAAADAAAGEAVYKQRCAVCHGQGGAADTPMAKMLKPPPASFADAQYMSHRSDEDLTKVITEGKRPMPKYGDKLSAEQIQNVLAFVRTLAK